jgi:hypothetical protein
VVIIAAVYYVVGYQPDYPYERKDFPVDEVAKAKYKPNPIDKLVLRWAGKKRYREVPKSSKSAARLERALIKVCSQFTSQKEYMGFN